MPDLAQQLTLLDTLTSNWEVIRSLAGGGPALSAALNDIAQRLVEAGSPDDLARLVDELERLLLKTPAHDFVQGLVARADLGMRPRGVVRSLGRDAAVTTADDSRLAEAARRTGQSLGHAIAAPLTNVAVPVFFATNRATRPGREGGEAYGGEPARTLSHGVAIVTIPVATHRIGRIEGPRWWTLFPNARAKERFVVLDEVRSVVESEFVQGLAAAVERASVRDVLVFIHGYNVTFDEAAKRAAQVCYDMAFEGPVILYTWPSRGLARDYAADEDRAAASGEHLAAFLESLREGPWGPAHLLAHSMGNRVLVSALTETPRAKPNLGQIALVAADVYVNVFELKFERMAGASVTSYASKGDRALLLSSRLHRGDRIGLIDDEPFVMNGLETVDASAVDTSLLGHSYFSSERSVLTDLGLLIREGLPAARRGLRQPAQKRYWMFPE